MLVAKEKVEYYGLPEEKPKTIQKKQKVLKLNKKAKVVCSFLVFAAFLVGLLFTSRYAQLSTTGIKLLEQKKALAALQLETEELEKEIKKLESLGRIENIATKKLGMQLPEGEGVYFLAVEYKNDKKVVKENSKTDLENAANKPEAKSSDTFVGAVSKLWGNWLIELEEAEATSIN